MSMFVLRLARFVLVVSAICFLHLLSVGQSESDHAAMTNRFDYGELAKVPERARARENPLERDPEAVLAGKKLFERNCAECHGNTGAGGKKAPSLRAEEIQSATPGAIFWILSNGVVRRGMPVWSKLPEPQRWAIVTYIKTLKTTSAATQ